MTECVLLTAWQMRARLACYLRGHVRKSGHRCLARHCTEVCRCLLVRNDISAHSLHLDAARCALSGAEHTVKSEFARSAGSLRDLKIASRLATLLLLHFLNPGIEASTHSRTAAARAIAVIKLLMFEVFAVDRLAHKFERNRVPGHTTAKWFLYACGCRQISWQRYC